MKWKETTTIRNHVKLEEEQRKHSIYCKVCGWTNHIYPVNKGRIICKNCGNYIYENNKMKFNYKMKEVMNKCKYLS